MANRNASRHNALNNLATAHKKDARNNRRCGVTVIARPVVPLAKVIVPSSLAVLVMVMPVPVRKCGGMALRLRAALAMVNVLKRDRVTDNAHPRKAAMVFVRKALPAKATEPSSRARRCGKVVNGHKVANVNSKDSNRNAVRKADVPLVKVRNAQSVRPWSANDL